MNAYLAKLAATSPAYAATFRGERVLPPTLRRREVFCVDRGPLVGGRTGCVGNDPHVCERYETIITHNGACQSCPGYEADA